MINPGGGGEGEEETGRVKKMSRPINDHEEEIHKLRCVFFFFSFCFFYSLLLFSASVLFQSST